MGENLETVDRFIKKRCEKLRSLRSMVNMSRREFSEKYHISSATLQSWESPNLGGISESGARQIIQCYAEQGIQIDFAWLMFDTGNSPSYWQDMRANNSKNPQRQVENEIQICVNARKSHAIYRLKDDFMLPRYRSGDIFIGSTLHPRQKESELAGCLCIVSFIGHTDNLSLGYISNVRLRRKEVWLTHLDPACEARKMGPVQYSELWPVTSILRHHDT